MLDNLLGIHSDEYQSLLLRRYAHFGALDWVQIHEEGRLISANVYCAGLPSHEHK